MVTNNTYLIFIHKPDLALNNLQWLIRHKPKPNQNFTCCFKLMIYSNSR